MPDFPYRLERSVLIQAKRETVFRFFTDSVRWASWWGAGSTIDARPGGRVYIRHANGVETLGEVLDVRPSEKIVFTYGYASGQPLAAGDSRVTILLAEQGGATLLRLLHEFKEAGARGEHIQGWRFQLSVFANVVANEIFANADQLIDGWFAAWAISDESARLAALEKVVTPEIQFRDRYSLLNGIDDLSAHIGAALRFMPGIGLRRNGDVRQCQGSALADWIAEGSDGQVRMGGTSVFVLNAELKISTVTGFTRL